MRSRASDRVSLKPDRREWPDGEKGDPVFLVLTLHSIAIEYIAKTPEGTPRPFPSCEALLILVPRLAH